MTDSAIGITTTATGSDQYEVTLTAGDLLIGSPTNTLSVLNAGTNGYYLKMVSGAPEWAVGGGGASPLTTKGDIYTYDTADARLAVGSNGTTLIADSTQTTGNKWGVLQEVGGGTAQSTYTTGDLLYASATDTLSKLSIGSIPGDYIIVNDSGVVQWDTDVIVLKDDFIFNTNQGISNIWTSARSATGNVTNKGGTTDHPGIAVISVAANSDDAAMTRGATQYPIVLGGGFMRLDFMIQIPTLATVGDDFTVKIGLGDANPFGGGTNFAGLNYDRSSSTDWIPKTIAGGSSTTASGGSAVAVDTNWTHIRMEVNAGATNIDFWVDGTDVGSCTTNIPTAAIAPQIIMSKTAGTGTVTVEFDAFRFYHKLTNSRWV